jgi:hypothetical protein
MFNSNTSAGSISFGIFPMFAQVLVTLQPPMSHTADNLLAKVLARHGGHVVHYIPDHTFLLLATAETVANLNRLPGKHKACPVAFLAKSNTIKNMSSKPEVQGTSMSCLSLMFRSQGVFCKCLSLIADVLGLAHYLPQHKLSPKWQTIQKELGLSESSILSGTTQCAGVVAA